jgi:hypothetical protein
MGMIRSGARGDLTKTAVGVIFTIRWLFLGNVTTNGKRFIISILFFLIRAFGVIVSPRKGERKTFN